MLTVSQFTELKEATIKGLEKKNFPNAAQVVEELNVLNDKRKSCQTKLDENLSKQNQEETERFHKNICDI